MYEKIWNEGRSKNMAIIVVNGVMLASMPQIIAIEAGLDGTEKTI